jgi:hypothetical protein
MMVHKSELENKQLESDEMSNDDVDQMTLPDSAGLGLQMDTEDVSSKIFEDLDNNNSGAQAEMSPADRISAKLANYQWVNQLQRRERIQFIRNFIKAAYDRGYAVELTPDLVVVGVTRVSTTKTVDIDAAIEKLEKQGL